MSAQSPQVFISYQRADEAFARQVREHLAAHGVRTWMDQYDISVGAYWPDEIDAGLGGSDVVVGVLSPDAIDSRNVKNEWDWALQNEKRLLLLQVAPCLIPHRYISINFIDATGPDLAPALASLSRALGGDAVSAQVDSPAATQAVVQPVPIRHSPHLPRPASRVPPFIAGREREQAILGSQLDKLLAGRGSLVLVGGEAGIGKTTLTSWLAAKAEARGAVVLAGGCYDLTTTPPYGPWGEIVRGWPEERGLPPVPEALRGGEAMARLQSQIALFELATDLLATAGTIRPIVLLLEDLHWADQPSLDLLRYLARLVTGFRIMLVATYRDDEVTRRHPLFALIPALAREAGAERVSLQRLGPEAVQELIAGRYTLADDERERLSGYVQRVTEGNPFFAGEVLRALEESRTIEQADAGWRLGDLDRVQVPDLVRQVIEGRLAHLGEDVHRQLQVAAVIGHEVAVDLWIAVSGEDEGLLSEVLDRATEARIVEELPGRASFRFSHALVRETLYDGLVSLRLRSWHRTVADALIATARPDPDAVAHHLQQAGDQRAFDWLVQAGDRARLSYAWIEAMDRYDRAVAMIADDPERVLARGWLLYRMAVLLRADNLQRGLDYLGLARQAAQLTGDRVLHVYVTFLEGLLNCFAGNLERGVANLKAADAAMDNLTTDDFARSGPYVSTLFLVGPDDDVSQYLRVNPIRGTLTTWLACAGRYRDALTVGEPYLASMPAEPLTVATLHARSEACVGLGHAYALLGQPEQANACFERALDGYGRFGHFWMIRATNQFLVADVLMPYASDDDEAWTRVLRDLAEMSPRLRGIGNDLDEYHLFTGLIGSFRAGDWRSANEFDHQTLIMTFARHPTMGGVYLTLAGEIARQQGNRKLAWASIAPFEPVDARQTVVHGDRWLNVPAFRLATDLCLDESDLSGARYWIEAYDRWLERSGAVLGRAEGALLHARYQLVAGDRTNAEAHARRSLQHSGSPRQPLALLAAHRFLGELATAASRVDEAEEQLRHALDLADACAAPFERALTLVAQAELALETGVDARETLSEARAICERLEAVPTLERIAALES